MSSTAVLTRPSATEAPLTPPTAAPAQPLVDDKLVLWWFVLAAYGTIVGPVAGLVASMKLDDPDLMKGVEWLQFGRFRIMHVNTVIFGAFTPAMFGLMCHAVPRLTGIPLWGIRAMWVALCLHALALVVGPISLLAGWIQPIEAGEIPLFGDVVITLVFVLVTASVLGTVARRKEKKLYVTLWYWIGSLVWTVLNYPIGNFVLPYFTHGTTSAAFHGFYLHDVVGLWITPAGVGAAYYLLPVASRSTLFSHRLSIIGFWSLAFFYPLNGVHHYLYSTIADWTQTIAIASSMMLILPVWAFCVNMFGTMRGQWSQWAGPGSYVLKFTVLGVVWYLITCFQGPTQALRGMQALTHFGDYNVGHAHSAVFAVFVIWALASAYLCVPRAARRELWSPKLATWTYWLEIMGFAIMFSVLSISGFQQGAMLQSAQVQWIDTVDAVRGLWVARTFGGTLMDVGLALFVFNLAMTAKRGRRTESRPPATAAY
jgi:cytochrome c oxidase cbb3-type subunit 1